MVMHTYGYVYVYDPFVMYTYGYVYLYGHGCVCVQLTGRRLSMVGYYKKFYGAVTKLMIVTVISYFEGMVIRKFNVI